MDGIWVDILMHFMIVVNVEQRIKEEEILSIIRAIKMNNWGIQQTESRNRGE